MVATTFLKAETVKEQACGRYNEIVETLIPELADALQNPTKGIPCPCHGSKDGFNLGRDFNETGRGYCQLTGSKDIFAILEMFNGGDFKEAVKKVADFLEGDFAPEANIAEHKGKTLKAKKKKEAEIKATKGALHVIWAQTKKDNGFIRKYFVSRDLFTPVPRNLRFHPALKYWETNKDGQPVCIGTYPAMVAKVVVRGRKGMLVEEITRRGKRFKVEKMVGLHITYLKPDGSGLADVPRPRKMRSCSPSFSGGVIVLHEHNSWPGTTLFVGEGIETCLAAYKILGNPVYCAMTAGNLQRVKLPDFIEKVDILADRDISGAGEKAANELRTRLVEEFGKFVNVLMPNYPIPQGSKSFDWNDFLMAKMRGQHSG